MKAITLPDLLALKQRGEKITVLTAYDATQATLVDAAGIELILVGDSLGMVVQGQDSTLPVSVADMAYHVAAVKRGCRRALVIADMPFMSYSNAEMAQRNAAHLMQAGAQMVKLEGGAWLVDSVQALARQGVPVCGHLGLTPQSVHTLGGYRVQGRDDLGAERLQADALALEAAGIQLLVLECVPVALARSVSQQLRIPVIGIGAGPDTDGQVLVLYDMLGMTPGKRPRFVQDFLAGQASVAAALAAYVQAVKSGQFPGEAHSFH